MPWVKRVRRAPARDDRLDERCSSIALQADVERMLSVKVRRFTPKIVGFAVKIEFSVKLSEMRMW